MQDFKAYLAEIESLKIQSVEFYVTDDGNKWTKASPSEAPNLDYQIRPYLTLEQYRAEKSEYTGLLRKLEQRALTDVLTLNAEAVTNQLKFVQQTEDRLRHIIMELGKVVVKVGKDLNKCSEADLSPVLIWFIIENRDYKGSIDHKFMIDFFYILISRVRSIGTLRAQLANVLGIKEDVRGIDYGILTTNEVIENEHYKELFGCDKPSVSYLQDFRRIINLTKEEAVRYNRERFEPVLKEGDEWFVYNEPRSNEERWEQFVKYDAQKFCELLQVRFVEAVGGLDLEMMRRRLEELEEFVKSTEDTGVGKALGLSSHTKPDFKNAKEEYLRLTNGYYKNHPMTESYNLAWAIYSEYVLFKEWLESQLTKLEDNILYGASGTSGTTGTSSTKNQPRMCFSDYLTPEGVRIYPQLQEVYRGTKPARQVYMIKALEDFQAIKKNCERELTDFHEALINSFGGTWTREAFRKQFDKMSGGTSPREEAKISTEKKVIRKFYEALKVAN